MLPSNRQVLLGDQAAADGAGDIHNLRFIKNRAAQSLDIFVVAEDTTNVVLRPTFRQPRRAGDTSATYADYDVQYGDASQDITLTATGNVRRRLVVTPGMDVGLRVVSFTGGAGKKVSAFGVLVQQD